MKVISQAAEFAGRGRPVCLAIGFFDGVHLGHQQVIRQTIADAHHREGLPVVITFDRHPNTIVAPDRVPKLIYPLPRKLRAIESIGVETTVLIHFDQAFSLTSGPDFVRQLALAFGSLASVCVGANFVFGHQRSGDVALLRRLGAELGFKVHGMSTVALDGQVISSTRIRQAIHQGDLDAADQMLGRSYSISGPVIRGDELGRKLGFPTANIDVSALALPPNGVYAVQASANGQTHHAVLNIGLRPTLRNPVPELRAEAHLLDFSGDLYGCELEITPVARLRDERQFASLDDLKNQITADIEKAREMFR